MHNGKLMPLGWDDLAALSPAQRKLRLLEKMVNSEAALKRFWRRVRKGRKNSCWPWTGGKTQKGYGKIAVGHKGKIYRFQCPRVSYFIAHGEFKAELFVCHRCDNPICVNPHHLFLGTNRVNQLDKVSKKRHAVGQEHGSSFLRNFQVQRIRIRFFVYGEHPVQIAKCFKVCKMTVWNIIHGKNWNHLSLPIKVKELLECS